MPSESGDRRAAKPGQMGAPPPEPEHLPCPRCDSINTKFCYYNNYNFSQPRHFCKGCRRYWTHGGTLRDIPVGGGSRKNAKRSRTNTTSTSSSAASALDYRHVQTAATPVFLPLAGEHGRPVQFVGDGKPNLSMCGSFSSLLGSHGPGLLSLGGFGLGVGHGFEDLGFGLGRAVWPFPGVGDGGATATNGGGGTMIGNTWQLESGEGGFVGGDCFSFPDLAISTPGAAMKQ
ncbi:hypothetical protein RJ640_012184 [Escallonia rubra]|uniref:Dof zinc finger protein n=1 Tax=Escallonia rubra TaxID=112253 RepID=A0AA88RZU5_9ASTE|nr:hypothetical protein RJ640_012184 [Escallonia rubra]